METIHSFADLADAMGVKIRKRTPQKEWATAQKEKFLRCPMCGHPMVYEKGTNVVHCVSKVDRNEKPLFNKEGKPKVCGYLRLLDEDSVGYANFIFSVEV